MSLPAEISLRIDRVRAELFEALVRDEPLVLVKAPPGSGKTRLILEAAALVRDLEGRVAIAAQTNTQADDICERLSTEFPFDVIRFASSSTPEPSGPVRGVTRITAGGDLPRGPAIVVGTAAKWLYANPEPAFDYLLVDEAWQLANVDFMLMDQISSRFVMVGDPGQIAPVISIETARWATADEPPHVSAPELILNRDSEFEPLVLELPVSFRLPHDSVPPIREFYDFHFEAAAGPEDRGISFGEAGDASPVDPVLDLLESGSICAATLPTPPEGPPIEEDVGLAHLAVDIAGRMVSRGATLSIDGEERGLEYRDIGFCATHRLMNARLFETLPDELKNQCMVDTAERWQGIERSLMIIVHPVSGTTRPTTFDLQTERLCVMASRHKVGLVIVTRDHLATTLAELIPTADQHVGLPDAAGAGLSRQRLFWSDISDAGRVVEMQTGGQ